MVLKSYCTAKLKNKIHKEKRFTYEMSWEKCFMCNKINISASIRYESIDKCVVPASNKPISVVLQHLANLVQTKLVFQPGACICRDCLKELTEYDALMLNLLATQKKLTQQLQESLRSSAEHSVESNAEVHIEVVEIADDDLKTDEPQKRKMEIDVISSDKEDGEECAVDVSERKRKRQECVMCGEEFRSKYQLQNHVAETHNSQVVHTCNICGVVRRDEEYLELHMNIHEGKTENECRYCPKKFSRPVNTLRHMRMHWDKKKYQCEKCGERFSLDNMLYNHRLRHEAEENPLICNICNQSFKSRKTFNHHILIHQDNRPRHYCNKCPKSFTERYTLKMHMKSHENTLSSQLEPIAHLEEEVSQLKSETQLNEDDDDDAHLTVIVEEVQSTDLFVSCVICSLNFESKELLEQHLQSEHDVILES